MRKLAIAIAVLFIAACGGTDYQTEPTHSTVTITKEAEPVTPEPVTVTVEPTEDALTDDEIDAFLNSEEVNQTVIELAWTGMTGEDQADICYAWKNIPDSKDVLLDSFFDGFGDEYAPSRQFMRDFFDEKCL